MLYVSVYIKICMYYSTMLVFLCINLKKFLLERRKDIITSYYLSNTSGDKADFLKNNILLLKH